MKKSSLLKTPVLDCAAYLYARGLPLVKLQRTGVRAANFYFPDTKETRELMKKFQQGKTDIMITAYLYARSTLKQLVSQDLFQTNIGTRMDSMMPGTPYYYIDNNTIVPSIYGRKDAIHDRRIAAKNFFLTRADAIRANVTKNNA